jgi:Uri superfamily endonuclease
MIDFMPGSYAYVGSALGPGGLAARLNRHILPADKKRLHWHIDFLLCHANLQAIAWSTYANQNECDWATALEQLGQRGPNRFGASDCRCSGHLIQFQGEITIDGIVQTIPTDLHIREFNTA